VQDLRQYQAGAEGGVTPKSATDQFPRVLYAEELLSMCYGFRLTPKHLSADDVRHAVKEMQTSSTAETMLQPMRREHFDEALLRLAHLSAAKLASSVRQAEAGRRLDELLRLMLLYDVPRMRALVSEHRLREACAIGDVDVTRELIGQRVAVDARDYDGWTALHRASVSGHDECVQALLAASASLPQRGPNGYAALHFAAEFGQLRVVNLLLHARATPADVSDHGWTPLQRAAIDGHKGVVTALLTNAPNYPIDATDKAGDTALHDASRNGHVAVVRELLLAKAQIDAPNHAGHTPLDVARKAGRKDVADFLLNKVRAANKKVQGGML